MIKWVHLGLIVCTGLLALGCQTGLPKSSPPDGKTTAKLIEINTRPGVRQKFILIQPEQPVAAVILFAGGHGNLGLTGARSANEIKSNFLVRTRSSFAKHGLMVALVDAPSDRKTGSGLHGFRSTPEHVTDIEAVIAFVRTLADIPVWLVGTSRGTISAAHIANSSKSLIDGLVLTSSMFQITYSNLSNINVPALVVAHSDDKCTATPPSWAPAIAKRMSNAPKAEVLDFKGGWPAETNPCKALSQHGFYGIEKKVVNAIADFIKDNSVK